MGGWVDGGRAGSSNELLYLAREWVGGWIEKEKEEAIQNELTIPYPPTHPLLPQNAEQLSERIVSVAEKLEQCSCSSSSHPHPSKSHPPTHPPIYYYTTLLFCSIYPPTHMHCSPTHPPTHQHTGMLGLGTGEEGGGSSSGRGKGEEGTLAKATRSGYVSLPTHPPTHPHMPWSRSFKPPFSPLSNPPTHSPTHLPTPPGVRSLWSSARDSSPSWLST